MVEPAFQRKEGSSELVSTVRLQWEGRAHKWPAGRAKPKECIDKVIGFRVITVEPSSNFELPKKERKAP